MRGKKKFIYLFMTAFVLCMGISVVSFAATTNRISNVVTGDVGTVLADGTNGTLEAPTLRIYERDLNEMTSGEAIAFQLDLTNADWLDEALSVGVDSNGYINGVGQFIDGMNDVEVTRLSDSSIIIGGSVDTTPYEEDEDDNSITVRMFTELTDEGDATVTVDPLDSVISSGSYKFATVAKGSTTTTISGIVEIPEEGGKINNIVIKETAPMTIKSGNIVLELSKGWEFSEKPEIRGIYPSNLDSFFTVQEPEGGLCIITVADDFKGSDSAMTISISASVKYNENAAGFNNICEMTVSGASTTRTTIEVAIADLYEIEFYTENRIAPEFYPNENDSGKETLEIHIEEVYSNSIFVDEEGTITLPEGIDITGYKIRNYRGFRDGLTGSFEQNVFTFNFGGEENRLNNRRIEFDISFTISVSSGFRGNIEAILGGGAFPMAIDEQYKAVIGKVISKTSGGSSGSGSSGGGSSSYNRTSSITKSSAITNGSVYCNLSSAKRGNEVEFFVFPDEGYRIVDVRVKDGNGNSLDITKKANGVYSFTMPSTGVDIEADFELIPSIVISNNQVPFNNTSDYPERRFSDVYQNDWYYDNIMWAVENGIAQGYDDGTFRPNEQITRAEMVIMLKNLYDSMYE